MEVLYSALSEALLKIAAAALLVFAAWAADKLKSYWQSRKNAVNNDTVLNLAKIAVQATEQVCKDARGEEKLDTALGFLSGLLAQAHLKVEPDAMRAMIEAAVAQFNGVFAGDEGAEPEEAE